VFAMDKRQITVVGSAMSSDMSLSLQEEPLEWEYWEYQSSSGRYSVCGETGE
jgi:hypothetical protein